jgi:hypothetical protein
MLDDSCHQVNHDGTRRLMLQASTGFVPKDGIFYLVWNEKSQTTTLRIVCSRIRK